jgi:3-dehydroquinate synthetase
MRRARSFCRFAISRNAVPFAPHLHYTQFLDDDIRKERNVGISCGVAVLSRCDQMWVFGERITAGMMSEIQAAKRLGVQIRYFDSRCREGNKNYGGKQ